MPILFQIGKICFQSGKLYSAWMLVQRILDGIVPNFQVLIAAELIAAAGKTLSGRELSEKYIYFLLFLLAVFTGYTWLSKQCLYFVEEKLLHKLRESFRVQLIQKCEKIKYASLETVSMQDLIHRVTKEPETELCDGYKICLELLSIVLRVLGFTIIIVRQVWWCGLLILILYLPLIWGAVQHGKVVYQAEKDAELCVRRYEYFGDVLTEREYAAERTIFQFEKYVEKKWVKTYDCAYKMLIKAFFSYFFKTQLYGICSVFIVGVMIVLLIPSVINGRISTGLFMMITSSILSVTSMITMQVVQCVKKLAEKKAYMEDVNLFIESEDDDWGDDFLPQRWIRLDKIEFQDVSFRYPGTEQYILNHINLVIEGGCHCAFVGENGAGKTTLVKLLSGLYREYEGNIFINGKELKQWSPAELRSLMAIVHQDYAKYSICLADNVAIGDLESNRSEIHIQEALKKVHLDFICPNTVLGKLEQEDQELSEGQWQRVAIARAFYKNAPLYILDEPTASMDPVSEREILEQYNIVSQNRTTIFISHRLGSVRFAQKIYVLENGSIAEHGTFEQLMKMNGLFRTMYETQRRRYQ